MSAAVHRVLIANRGEIAIRIMRACRELGIETVAVYSDADRTAPHVRAADHAVHIGPTPARASYLDVDRIIAAAVESGADALHPGYGFLSEQADFADACAAAGLTFIGPGGAAMRAAGDKTSAKALADAANVPTVPTWPIDAVPDSAFPVLVKAAAGGGGRGMRIVAQAADLPGALESARREAAAGFGDDTLLVEQLISAARHVEVQLLADTHGTCLYVGDRDCSLQRRHQKVVEEAPAPGLGDKLRASIGEAAVRIAQAAGYVNAGTAEFLVDPATGEFWFLELNARLQVEHPVTELAFGIDLVHWQLRIARGEHLQLTQSQIRPVAFAMEARLYAEDPITLLPTGGRVAQVELPTGPGVRVDHALEPGMNVSLAYDPLLGKIITVGATRDDTRLRLLEALEDVFLPGVVTNGTLLVHALCLPDFIAARHDIGTLSANLLTHESLAPSAELVAGARQVQLSRGAKLDPFVALNGWRLATQPGAAAIDVHPVLPAHCMVVGDRLWFAAEGRTYDIARTTVTHDSGADGIDHAGAADHATLIAPMPGTVLSAVTAGATVSRGETVVTLEAMKMENAITAPFDGVVKTINCAVGDMVARGTIVAELTSTATTTTTTSAPTATAEVSS